VLAPSGAIFTTVMSVASWKAYGIAKTVCPGEASWIRQRGSSVTGKTALMVTPLCLIGAEHEPAGLGSTRLVELEHRSLAALDFHALQRRPLAFHLHHDILDDRLATFLVQAQSEIRPSFRHSIEALDLVCGECIGEALR